MRHERGGGGGRRRRWAAAAPWAVAAAVGACGAARALREAPGHALTGPGVTATFAITYPQPYHVAQRGTDDAADIDVVVQLGAVPVRLEGRCPGRDWQPLAETPVRGRFRGTLRGCPAGQGALSVRIPGPGGATAAVDPVGVGELFVVAGQSNAEGRAAAPQRYRTGVEATLGPLVPSAFTEHGRWIPADDPVDVGTAEGSVWPLVAGHLSARLGVPVGFVTTARGGTSLVSPPQWQPGGADCGGLPGSCYDRMLRQMDLATHGTRRVRAVLLWLGGADAGKGADRAQFRAGLERFRDALAPAGGPPPPVVVVDSIPLRRSRVALTALDDIRRAQVEAWERPGFFAGPGLCDLDLDGPGGDGLHLRRQRDVEVAAARWEAWLARFVAGGGATRPRLVAAKRTDGGRVVALTVVPGTGLLASAAPGGLRFRAAARGPGGSQRLLTPTRLTVAGPGTLAAHFDAPVPDGTRLDFGAGNDGCLLWDLSEERMPVAPAYDLPVE